MFLLSSKSKISDTEMSLESNTIYNEAFISTPSPKGPKRTKRGLRERSLEEMNKKPKRAFSTAFKLQVIVASNVTSTEEQARIHNIDEKIIWRWCQFWDPLLKPSSWK